MIMEITLINDSNYSAFWNMFFDGTDLTRKDILRIGAVEQGIAVGALSAGFTSGTCNIRSLYTVSDKRRRGAAHGMLHKLKSILAKSSYDVIKSDFASDTDGVAEFFESEGFILHEGEGFYQTCLQDFLESNIVKKFSLINTEGFEYFHLEDLSNSEKNAVVGLLEERGFDKSYTDLKSLDQHLSSVVYDYGHKPQQCLLASSNEEFIFVKLIVSLQKSADAGSIVLPSQLKGFLETLQAQDEAEADRVIRFEAQNPKVMPTIRRMAGKEVFEKICGNVSAVNFI
jgi:hypothetical protein